MPYRPTDQNCSIARSLAIVGERWTLVVVRELAFGRQHFEEIRRNTGVASNILSDRLATLVDHGVVERRGDPPEYHLTPKGRDLAPVLGALTRWGDRYTAGDDGPPRVAVHDACGHDANPKLVCSHCGEELRPGETHVRPGPGANARQRDEGPLPFAALPA